MAGNDANTILLYHFDGSDGGTTFTDDGAGTGTHNGTATGSTVTHTTSFVTPKFGTASCKSAGGLGANYISTADAAELRPGSGDFTYDWWVNYRVGSWYHDMIGKGVAAAGAIYVGTSNADANPKIFIKIANTLLLTETTGSTTGSWIHKAIVRSGGTLTFYSDGTANGSVADSSDFNNTSALQISGVSAGGALDGNMDEFRFSNIARWTANFTPPTAAYSAPASLPFPQQALRFYTRRF